MSEALLRRGDEVIGVDNFNAFYDPAFKETNVREVEAAAAAGKRYFRLVRADIVTSDALDTLFETPGSRPDVVCHLAAWAGVRPSIVNPMVYQETNVQGTMRLLELCRCHGVRSFVFASSSSVYGARERVPFHEDDPVDDPISPYAATKKAGELFGHTYAHLFGIRFVGLRFFTVYGPRQRPEMAIHLFARRILDEQPIRMFGDGSSSRDYTYIEDITEGVVAAVDRAHTIDGYRIYNLGGSETTTLADLVAHLEVACGVKARVQKHPEQPGDVPRTFADVDRARRELGYAPRTPVPDGIANFVQWLRARRAGR